MNFRKNYYLLTFFLILIIQILLFTNNNHKTAFRYFKWNFQEVSVGKLISISFFSGLFISILLNNTVVSNKNSYGNVEQNYNPQDNEEDLKSNIEMPPQRDIRDTQPTISVNYRIIKNNEGKTSNGDQYYSDNPNNGDDWDKNDSDW